jgi:arylsulfatase A-like enzyme
MKPSIHRLFFATIACCAAIACANKPNIILILADDLGPGDIGRQHTERTGNPALAATPSLDALANEGMWFTDAHSPTSLCSPSRYAIMTGNYNFRSYAPWGVWGTFRPSAITEEDTTLGLVAKQGGYRTGFIGKWHLGGDFYQKGSETIYRGDDRGNEPLDVDMSRWISAGPQDLGFDYDYTLPTGVQGPIYLAFENGKWAPFNERSELIHYDKNTAKDPLFVSDKGPGPGDSEWDCYEINKILAAKAAGFIKRNASEREPFFLCYWSPAVHIPHTPPVELDGKKIRGTTPTLHTDMNRVIDWEVGKIIQALKESGEYDNTLIIFTSDNGGLYDATAKKAGHRSNGGYVSGNKNSPLEGGHLVPFIVSYPGIIEAGSRNNDLVNGTDIIATLAKICGVRLKDAQAKDSKSFIGALIADKQYKPRRELMLQAGSRCEAMLRQGKWKLILQSDFALSKWDPIGLYDLEANPMESPGENLLKEPEHAARLEAMINRYHAVRNDPGRSVAR